MYLYIFTNILVRVYIMHVYLRERRAWRACLHAAFQWKIHTFIRKYTHRYMYTYVNIHTYIYVYNIYTYIYRYIYIYLYLHMYILFIATCMSDVHEHDSCPWKIRTIICKHMTVYIYIYANIKICTYFQHVHMYIYICTYTCTYIDTCIYHSSVPAWVTLARLMPFDKYNHM
jgi:hypothetical protein